MGGGVLSDAIGKRKQTSPGGVLRRHRLRGSNLKKGEAVGKKVARRAP